jgi:hypothetical protein
MSKSNQTICHICFSPVSEAMIECSKCKLMFHQDTCGENDFIDKQWKCKNCRYPSVLDRFYSKSEDLKRNLDSTSENIQQLYSDTDLKIKSNLDLVDTKINSLYADVEQKLLQIKTKRKSMDWVYVALLCIVFIPLTGWLVYKGWATKPDVTIDYSIGEIIGGILIGGGAIIAGTAYSRSVSKKDENNTDRR